MKHVQPRLDQLGAYPFERLNRLLDGLTPNPGLEHIDAGAGEPRLPLAGFVGEALLEHASGFCRYPPSRGSAELRQAVCKWLKHRYGLAGLDADAHVISANGTREALFAVAHALVNPEADAKPFVAMPNPMYQIYLGAAVTAGAVPYFLSCKAENAFEPRLEDVPEDVWRQTALTYVCSPSNPTGWTADEDYYARLLALADQHDFFILADECYSEIYWQEPPIGLLEAAEQHGRKAFSRCLVFNSLSKRSAMPGLRSGFVAGDAELVARFAKLRSYTGPATPLPLQHVAAAAWADEAHVQASLNSYRASLKAFYEAYGEGAPPAGAFFVWLPVGEGNDEAFAKTAFEQQAVTILPGRYLGAADHAGVNPGVDYIRAALVDGPGKAAELARRLKAVRI